VAHYVNDNGEPVDGLGALVGLMGHYVSDAEGLANYSSGDVQNLRRTTEGWSLARANRARVGRLLQVALEQHRYRSSQANVQFIRRRIQVLDREASRGVRGASQLARLWWGALRDALNMRSKIPAIEQAVFRYPTN